MYRPRRRQRCLDDARIGIAGNGRGRSLGGSRSRSWGRRKRIVAAGGVADAGIKLSKIKMA